MKKLCMVLAVVFGIILAVSCGKTPAEVYEASSESTPAEVYEASSEVIDVTAHDGYTFKGRLTTPEGGAVSKLVIFVNGSGANTYDNPRIGFNYFDFYAEEFAERGIAFFSYSTRGVEIGDEPPMFVEINDEEFQTYLPSNSVEDVYSMIKTIKEKKRLKNAEVYLLGWSEGAVIAPLVAEKYPDEVDSLLLAGYVNQNLRDVLTWQNTGGPSMAWYKAHFEADGQGRISKAAYEADPKAAAADILQNLAFEDIDANSDGYITGEDFIAIMEDMLGYSLDDVLSAIERRDDEWLKANYGEGLIPLTSGWFLEHFALRSNMEVLPGLDLPIHIFHGVLDQNVDVNEVYKIDQAFAELGKTNLTVHVFENHDHDLNYADIITKNEIPQGIMEILDTAKEA